MYILKFIHFYYSFNYLVIFFKSKKKKKKKKKKNNYIKYIFKRSFYN